MQIQHSHKLIDGLKNFKKHLDIRIKDCASNPIFSTY